MAEIPLGHRNADVTKMDKVHQNIINRNKGGMKVLSRKLDIALPWRVRENFLEEQYNKMPFVFHDEIRYLLFIYLVS